MEIATTFHRHLQAEIGSYIVADGGSYAVAHLVEVLKIERNGDIGGDGFLTVEIAFPTFVKLVAKHCRETCIAIGGACPKHVVEIASNGNGEAWRKGCGILSREVLRKADSSVGMFSKLGEH